MTTPLSPPFRRYVAIGDSSTEGLDDPDGRGGFRGWANRLAEAVAAAQGELLYANLGIRGKRTAEIRAEQLGRAVDMAPGLATIFSGTNDVVARRFDVDRVGADIEAIQTGLMATGATVVTFTLPDLTPVMPLARLVRARVAALNDAIREAAARSGVIVVDVARHPVATDPRLWSEDRLHANALGHARIAQALGEAIGLPAAGPAGSWAAPLAEEWRRSWPDAVGAEWRWVRRHLAPWIWRHLNGRSSGDGIREKRPELAPLQGS